jgi:hypothetical protein
MSYGGDYGGGYGGGRGSGRNGYGGGRDHGYSNGYGDLKFSRIVLCISNPALDFDILIKNRLIKIRVGKD